MALIARKRFGQNFLHDSSVVNSLLANLNALPGQHFVEIGPGRGALTDPLLQKGIRLDAVELDRDLVILLKARFGDRINLTIHSADALKFDFSALAAVNERFRVIGNLPYNISTPLLFHLLDYATCIDDMHFMLQKEVVERICAHPGTKQYGRLGIMIGYFCAAEHLFDIAPESFDPPPKVTSSIIRLTPYRKHPVDVENFDLLNRVVSQAFSQRRKTLRNALQVFLSEYEISALAIDPQLRPECLSLSDFAKLSNFLNQTGRQ